MNTLRTLKDENNQLLQQLRGEDLQGVKIVSISVVDRLKLDLVEMEKEKRMRRLREIWTDKAAEFRASVLGYHVHFLPNGKVRVKNIYYNKNKRKNDNGEEDAEDDTENSIMFDGEAGTMKISGGPNRAFAQEIKELVKYWAQDRKEIPCFLAAMTLEFYDRGVSAGGET
jgi:mitotic spindle assembly checkpoint protein MAD1